MWGIYLRTWFKGQYVGQDRWGNRYYRQKGDTKDWRTEPRWVLYKGIPEASKVPSLWNSWLRHDRQYVPLQNEKSHFWERPHLPNLTGTPFAFTPLKSLASKGQTYYHPPYQAWSPPPHKKNTHRSKESNG